MLRPSFRKLLRDDNWTNPGDPTEEDQEWLNGTNGGNKTRSQPQAEMERSDSKWDSDRSVYEMQLNQLQEQLVATMVENQQLGEELKILKEKGADTLIKELEDERKRNKKLEEQIKKLKPKRPSRPPGGSKKKDRNPDLPESDLPQNWEDLGKDNENTTSGDSIASGIAPAHNLAFLGALPAQKDATIRNGNPTEPIDEKDSPDPGSRRSRLKAKYLQWKIIIWNFIHERLSDFIIDDAEEEVEEEDEPLAIRTTLRENVSRFTEGVRPIRGFVKSVDDLFGWKNPWLTLSAFLIYMYSVWLGYFLPLVLFLAILKLSVNYLFARGLAQRFGYQPKKQLTEEESKEEAITSWSERYQLVLHIARRVQNTLGHLADFLEKLESLFTWEHEEATRRLYTTLWIGFIASLILSTRFFFFVAGIGLGIKMFLITPLYKRFPKVKRRYDNVARIWEELPIRKDRDKKESREETDGLRPIDRPSIADGDGEVLSRPGSGMSGDIKEGEEGTSSSLSWEAIVFCDRFSLPQTEAPIDGWQDGRRCTLMNKESPLSNMKHGRLYLTKNYLCFERNQFHSKKNFAIRLQEVVKVEKMKPFSFIPGVGMSIEVTVKGVEKPYLFAAMMGRDEAYESILRAARALNLSWGRKSA